MTDVESLLDEGRIVIPSCVQVEQLLKYVRGGIVARGKMSDAEIAEARDLREIPKSEVRTTNPAYTQKLLNLDDFTPNLYRCTFRDTTIENYGDGYDYSIGYLPERSISRAGIKVDEILGVDGGFAGKSSEVVDRLNKSGIEDVQVARGERKV